eukprot:6845687-Alexandrium_andersonii.AAC.2
MHRWICCLVVCDPGAKMTHRARMTAPHSLPVRASTSNQSLFFTVSIFTSCGHAPRISPLIWDL